MSKQVEDCITAAAAGFASIPQDYQNAGIKDSIPQQPDWKEFNRKFCACINASGCPIMESELDEFWSLNKEFSDLISYIDEQCGYAN
ncbi:MAG TPA: hypothetical protein VII11_09410 [Bacteroidota bacterium]